MKTLSKEIHSKECDFADKKLSNPSILYVYEFESIEEPSLADSNIYPSFFEVRDVERLKDLVDYISNNEVKQYSTYKALSGNYKIRFVNGNFKREYYLNTLWKKDSVCIVPEGYQYYIPMHISKWDSLCSDASILKKKKFNISNIEVARKIYNYSKKNKLIIDNYVKDDSDFPRATEMWLKYNGSFFYETIFNKEDILEVREKIKLRKEYPKDKFDLKYNYIFNTVPKIFKYGVVVYCDKEFYDNFKNTNKSKWTKFSGYFEVSANKETIVCLAKD